MTRTEQNEMVARVRAEIHAEARRRFPGLATCATASDPIEQRRQRATFMANSRAIFGGDELLSERINQDA